MMKTIRIAGAALFLFSFAFVAKTTHAQTDNWTGALSHDWFTDGNWDTDNVPTATRPVRSERC